MHRRIAVLIAAAVGHQKFIADSPDQIAAKHNLTLIEQIDQAWIDHKQRPRTVGILDPDQFKPLRSDLLAVNLNEANDDVKALHRRFIAFVDRFPMLLDKFKVGPSQEPPSHPAVQQRAAEDWSLDVRNLGIQLENDLEALQDEIKKLRAAYTCKAKTR